MALIRTIPPAEAQGELKEIYRSIKKVAPVIPKPLSMLSTSPELTSMYFKQIMFYLRNPGLGMELLVQIRLHVAHEFDYPYCVGFNSSILQFLTEITDQGLEELKKDPTKAELSDKDKALLLFVLKAVKAPTTTTAEDIDQLRALGWQDREILEATNYGADMVRHGIVFKAFKMDQD